MTVWTPKLSDGSAYAKARLRGTVWERVDVVKVTYGLMTSIGGGLGKLGISPNALTGFSLVLAALSAGSVIAGWFGASAGLMIASGLCDVLDGAVARATGKGSRFGALLDSTVDRVADALPLVALVVFFASQPWLAVVPAIALVGTFVVPYVRARAEGLGVTLPPLFMRRAERLVLLVLSLLLGTLPVAGALPHALLLVGVGIMAVLSFWGAVSALRSAYVELEPSQSDDSASPVPPPVRSRPVTASGP